MVATTLGKFRPNSNKFGVYWYQSVNILMYMGKPVLNDSGVRPL
jgi:hypothetical protein